MLCLARVVLALPVKQLWTDGVVVIRDAFVKPSFLSRVTNKSCNERP